MTRRQHFVKTKAFVAGLCLRPGRHGGSRRGSGRAKIDSRASPDAGPRRGFVEVFRRVPDSTWLLVHVRPITNLL